MIVTRDHAIPILRNVTVAEVTATIRDIPTEVLLGPPQGLARECVATCDNLHTVPKGALGRRRGMLGPEQTHDLNYALSIALGLD